jgi:tRNA(fMet)-specific endonuclease VapC
MLQSTKFEIYSGSTENQLEFWNQFFSRITILPFTTGTSQIAAHIFQQLKSKNKLIGIPDIFFGATAIENGLKLATLNVIDFVRIDQLILLQ